MNINFDVNNLKILFDEVGHVWLKFRYNPALIAEIKELRDDEYRYYEWQPDFGYWVVYTWEGWVLPKLFELLTKYFPKEKK